MKEPPEFKTGNKSFAKALNTLAAYARETGVNPAGRPGWSWSKDGWVPPYVFAGTGSTPQPWDLIAAPAEDPPADPPEWVVYNPQLVYKRSDVAATIAVTNDPFAPTATQWLVAKIDSLTTPAIEILCVDDWPEYPHVYDFSAAPDYDFVSAHIPLWRFYSTDSEGRVRLGEELFGQKLINPYPSIEFRLEEAATNILSMVIDLR